MLLIGRMGVWGSALLWLAVGGRTRVRRAGLVFLSFVVVLYVAFPADGQTEQAVRVGADAWGSAERAELRSRFSELSDSFGEYDGLAVSDRAMLRRGLVTSPDTADANVWTLFEQLAAARALGRAGSSMHPTRLLVRFKPGVVPRAGGESRNRSSPAVQWFLARGHHLVARYRAVDDLCLVEVPAGEVSSSLEAYRSDPEVVYAEPDYAVHTAVFPNDPDFGVLWGLYNTGQTVNGDPGTAGADIRASQAWDLWSGDPEFRIAVIDTGIDYTHPDLMGNIWTNASEIPGNGVDDDGNGWVDDVHGYDTYNEDGDPLDDNFHGSHVAGTIGAVGNNAVGVSGVAWRCRLVAVKAFDSAGGGYTSDVVEAIQYVVDSGISLSSNSWVTVDYSQALYDALAAAGAMGHLFVSAAGNFFGRNIDENPVYPASFDLPNILTVASIDNDDKLAIFTSIGPTQVDLSAPGQSIYSTLPGGGYGYLDGTSMSVPYVSGVAGLLMSRRADLSWQQVKDRILRTTRPVESMRDHTLSGGCVHAAGAVGDCNGNGVLDEQDIAGGTSNDCNGDELPDECESDCNSNGVADECDIAGGQSVDCNANSVPDECDLASGQSVDCNSNQVPDECDLSSGFSEDVNSSGVPDECETCDTDGECNDGDVCTFDQCLAGLCYSTYNSAACDDGIACTQNDVCSDGVCAGTLIPGLDCAPVFSLKASALNSVPLAGGPVDEVTLSPGDRVTVEVFVERWLPRLVRAYNVWVNPSGYISGSTGRLFPADDPDPSAARFIDQTRTDWLFFDRPTITVVWAIGETFTQYGSLVLLEEDCAGDTGSPSYLGTLVLEASATASGTFTVCLHENTQHATFLIDCPSVTNIQESSFTCLTVNVPLTDCSIGPDCNGNGQWDICDISTGLSPDCNRNDIPDECDLADSASLDCNHNTIPDECDLADQTSTDCNT
ncbi:MAG: S8 family peptidase, partial [Phycisphaerae bacterium]